MTRHNGHSPDQTPSGWAASSLLRHNTREAGLLGLIIIVATLGLLHLGTGSKPTTGGGWRAIDIEQVERRIEAGTLSDKEADWYHTEAPRP